MVRKGRRSRAVYDPSIGGDRLEKASVFENDPLALENQGHFEDDIRSDLRDSPYPPDIGTSGRSKQHSRANWKCLCFLVLAAVLTVIIAASMAARSDNDNSSSSSSSNTNPAADQPKPIPPSQPETEPPASTEDETITLNRPSTFMQSVCTPESISTTEGRLNCEDACEEMDCCRFAANLEMSCLAGNEDVCMEYHSLCVILEDEGIADPQDVDTDFNEAPDHIDEACSSQSLQTKEGVTSCKNLCDDAECCYASGVASCIWDDKCLDYDMCLGLKAIGHEHDDIPAMVKEKCDPNKITTEEGVLVCESVCSVAICCFAELEECPIQDRSFCTQYEPCTLILGEMVLAPETTMPPKTDNSKKAQVDAACATGLSTDCISMCGDALCCFESNEELQCANTNPGFDCTQYTACEVFY